MNNASNLFTVDRVLWSRFRDEAYRRFLEDIEIGYADRDIVDFIKLVFTKKGIYTTSSCSGRITIIDSLYPWLRDKSYVVLKKHEPIARDEIKHIISLKPMYRFWLISSGPILHFVAIDLEIALKLLKTVRSIGFKHSGIISLSRAGIVIEVISGTWTSFLLKDKDLIIINNIDRIIETANDILVEGKKRLEKLFKVFKEIDI